MKPREFCQGTSFPRPSDIDLRLRGVSRTLTTHVGRTLGIPVRDDSVLGHRRITPTEFRLLQKGSGPFTKRGRWSLGTRSRPVRLRLRPTLRPKNSSPNESSGQGTREENRRPPDRYRLQKSRTSIRRSKEILQRYTTVTLNKYPVLRHS